MKKIEYNDEIDIILYNFFNQSVDKEKFSNLIENNKFMYDDLKKRFLWLKEMQIDPNIIHLNENHKIIYEIFDKCNEMFNENNIEYYYTSGILSYLLINQELKRYHHDLDIFVNMYDLEKLEKVCNNYGFIFKRQLGDRGDGTKRVMLKLYYEKALEIPITLFMYVVCKDNTIEQNDYFISDDGFYVEKMYNSPLVVDLSFSNEPRYHNNIRYFSITLEALYLSKIGNRPKDIYDCEQFEKYLDLEKLLKLKKALLINKPNETYKANNDPFFDFIFSDFKGKNKALIK